MVGQHRDTQPCEFRSADRNKVAAAEARHVPDIRLKSEGFLLQEDSECLLMTRLAVRPVACERHKGPRPGYSDQLAAMSAFRHSAGKP